MATNYKKCKVCGKIFASTGGTECPQCIMETEKKFGLIKEYLYNNPNATVMQISEATEVEEKMILHFLKEGRLEMKSADGSLRCEKCGAAITSGRMCANCMSSLSNALSSVLPQKTAVEKDKTPRTGSAKPDSLYVNINRRK